MTADPIAIARDLLRCRSVTPDEGGALVYLQRVLEQGGFTGHYTNAFGSLDDMLGARNYLVAMAKAAGVRVD